MNRETSGPPPASAPRAAGFAALACLLAGSAFGQHSGATSPAVAGGHAQTAQPASRPGATASGARRTQSRAVAAHSSNVLGSSSGAPRPTWELPKNTTPHWEIPSYNKVLPNQVQGNRRHDARPAYGGGAGAVGYVGVPVYTDGLNYGSSDGSGDDPSQAAQQGRQRPEYAPEQQEQEDWGPAGPPPDVAERAAQEPPRQMTPAEAAAAQSDGLDHPEVTLVFNNGRPSKKIRSYALTNSSVFVSENGRQTQISIADLDLAATIAQNREAGVDFALPKSSR